MKRMTSRFPKGSRALIAAALVLPCVLAMKPSAGARATEASELSAWVPADALVYAELREGAALWDSLQGSDWDRALRAAPQFQEYLTSKDYLVAVGVVAAFEAVTKLDIEQVLRNVLGSRVAFAFRMDDDGKNKEAAFLARIHSLDEVVQSLKGVAKMNDEDEDAISSRGTGVSSIPLSDEAHLVYGENLVAVATTERLAREIAALHKGKGGRSLASRKSFVDSQEPYNAQNIFAWMDTKALASKTPGETLLPPKWDNALAHLLFGGLGDQLNRGEMASAGLELTVNRLLTTFRVPGEDPRKHQKAFFPAQAERLSIPPLKGYVGHLSLFRHLEPWWESRDDVFDASMAPDLAEFETNIALFFGGKPFVEVLEKLGDRSEFLIQRQEFEGQAPMPRLPGFALLLPVRHKDKVRDLEIELRIAFQTAVGIINADRAQNGLHLMLIGSESVDGVTVSTANFPKSDEEGPPAIRFNFQPALAVTDDWVMLSSSTDTVRQWLKARSSGQQTALADDWIRLEAEEIGKLLGENMEPLIANAMLEDGKSREEATQDLEGLATLVNLFDCAELRTAHGENGLEVTLSFDVAGSRQDDVADVVK